MLEISDKVRLKNGLEAPPPPKNKIIIIDEVSDRRVSIGCEMITPKGFHDATLTENLAGLIIDLLLIASLTKYFPCYAFHFYGSQQCTAHKDFVGRCNSPIGHYAQKLLGASQVCPKVRIEYFVRTPRQPQEFLPFLRPQS
mgnify:CR=1 FL=1